jgi:hypothetical protein
VYAIAGRDGALLTFAGIWEGWGAPGGETRRTFAILTTTANRAMTQLHERMPVILEPSDWPLWLGEAETSVCVVDGAAKVGWQGKCASTPEAMAATFSAERRLWLAPPAAFNWLDEHCSRILVGSTVGQHGRASWEARHA